MARRYGRRRRGQRLRCGVPHGHYKAVAAAAWCRRLAPLDGGALTQTAPQGAGDDVRDRRGGLESAMGLFDRRNTPLKGDDRIEPQGGEMSNPYLALKDHQYWRRSVAGVETHRFDPVTNPRFVISSEAAVATAGSCFAQHISRRLLASGLRYLVSESGDKLDDETRQHRQFGVFSARYGNVYTTTQLLQLLEEAFGHFDPIEKFWQRPDGRFVDPYRQTIEPDGFESPEAVYADRRKHLDAVRTMFSTADVFVFTLGLTEAWRSKRDGAVFSSAPGVVADGFDKTRHEFVNFGFKDVCASLSKFLDRLKVINPSVKVLLTVSPVPLIATYEDRSVLVSSVYSKSVLRVTSEAMITKYGWVDYFPSYEIIAGSYAGGLYYEDDWREVNSIGVAHAMRCFMRHYTSLAPNVEDGAQAASILPTGGGLLICDEELMDAVRD